MPSSVQSLPRCECTLSAPYSLLAILTLTIRTSLPSLSYSGDLGAVADTFGEPTHQPTCIAPSSLQATRRDFMFASPSLFAAVRNFRVIFQDETPVHGTIFVQLNFHALPSAAWIARKPSSLQAHLRQACESLLGQAWEIPRPNHLSQCDEESRGDEAAWRQAIKAQSRYRQQQHLH